MTVVAQPIINTFNLSDGQWGLLTGPPFALFYAIMGIPIAMWADRSNRVMIIAICVDHLVADDGLLRPRD